jgi:hypothetical protein
MTQTINSTTGPVHSSSLWKRILWGGGIAFLLISFFLLGAGEPNPAWPKFWWIQPLVVVPLAGATGGLFYHLMDRFRSQGGWKKAVATIVSILVYIIGLWLGTVLGLNGTMWD